MQVETFSFSQGSIASQVGFGSSQTGSGVSQVFASCLHLHLLFFLWHFGHFLVLGVTTCGQSPVGQAAIN